MSPPSSQALQELDRLDQPPSDFDDKLYNILYEQEYALHEESFEKDDLIWFIDYLDEVCPYIGHPRPFPLAGQTA